MTGILRRHETENVTEGIRLYKDRGRGWSDVVTSWEMPEGPGGWKRQEESPSGLLGRSLALAHLDN